MFGRLLLYKTHYDKMHRSLSRKTVLRAFNRALMAGKGRKSGLFPNGFILAEAGSNNRLRAASK